MVAEAAGEDSPSAAAFVEQWGRAGDSGVVADSEFEPVGAAWYRVFEESDPAAGFVGGVTPELVLAVDAEHRRRGVGTAMLRELLRNAAEDGHASMGLTVPTFNTAAVALFTQHGFSTVREAGGLLTMQAKLGS